LPTLDPAPFAVDLPPHWCIDRTGTDTVRSDPVCRWIRPWRTSSIT
jgi:hypothetical protein